MMTYIRLTPSGPVWPYSHRQLIDDNPNILFPTSLSAEDQNLLQVFEIASADIPQPDPATHRVVESTPALINGQWTQQWQVLELSPQEQAAYAELNPPHANWPGFKKRMLSHPMVNQLLSSAADSPYPAAALAVSAALFRAEGGNPSDFAGCWRKILSEVPAATKATLVQELTAAAQQFNLPAEFSQALAGQPVRARDSEGRYVPDDPATPENEAWI